jgi:CRISPR-associated protein Csm4
MNTYRIVLKPKSEITAFPSSDTLFGAICWGIRILYGEGRFKDVLGGFSSSNPPFVLSSSFPLSASGVMFFPKPKLNRLNPEKVRALAKERCKDNQKKKALFDIMSEYKRFAKISYLSENLFNSILKKKADEESIFKDFLNGTIVTESGLMMKKEEHDFGEKKFSQDKVRVRTKIDRLSGSTAGEGEMFHSETKTLGAGFSLFCLLKTDDINLLHPLVGEDKFLSDHGIGGDRTVGLNHFDLSYKEFDVKLNGQGKKFVTLSRYIPRSAEINKNGDMAYDILSWVSRVDNSYDFGGERFVKDRVFYMKEGSIFEANEKEEFYGRLMEVCEINDNRIYQNGLSFPVFFNS